MIVQKETLLRLNKVLGLNYEGYEQDWALEFADAKRISEFIQIFKDGKLTDQENYAVLSLILSSFDEMLNDKADSVDANTLWKTITDLIYPKKQLYSELLNYWALWNDITEENWFAITPLVRSYLANKTIDNNNNNN